MRIALITAVFLLAIGSGEAGERYACADGNGEIALSFDYDASATEPFTGLDQDSLKRFEESLHTFRDAGGTALLVTHSLGRGLRLADRVVILAGGRLAADEPRERLTDQTLQRLYAATTEDP